MSVGTPGLVPTGRMFGSEYAESLFDTPKHKAAPPTSEKEESALQLMRDHAIIGAQLGPLEYAAGDYAGRVFQLDHNSNLLPAELTFESLWVGRSQRPTFLPMDQDLHEYRDALCSGVLRSSG